MLYLLKSSRVQEYHQQNVEIVGAAESDRFEITYSDRWIASDVEVKAGDGCVVLFGDTPYDYFVPVRFGSIESADRQEGRLRLQVRVTAPVRAGGTDKINRLLSSFDRDDPDRPGKRFLFKADNPDLESPQSDSERDAAWVEIIDRLGRNGYFENTTFTRIRRLTTADGRPLEPGRAVTVGKELIAEVETRTHVGSIDSISLYIESEPHGAIELEDVGQLPPTGTVRLPFRVMTPGIVHAAVRALPEPLKSSRSVFQLTVAAPSEPATTPKAEPESLATPPQAEAAKAPDLTALIKYLERRADLDTEGWIGLCEVLLRDFNDADPAVLSRLASNNFDLGRFDDCVRTLLAIENRRPDEELQLVLAALRGGVDVDFADHMSRMDIRKESDFEDLLAAVKQTDRVVLERVTTILYEDILGDERSSRLVEAVFSHITSIDLALRLANQVAHVDPLTGTRLLLNRWRPESAPEGAVDLLLDWKDGGNRLAPYYERRIDSLTASSRYEDVLDLVEPVRRVLSGSDQLEVCRRIGVSLFESESPAVVAVGFDLLLQSINEELAYGQFETAAVLAERLLGYSLVANDEERSKAASSLRDLALAEILGQSDYINWMAFVTDSAATRLRPSTSGKTLHLVGGRQFDWLDELHRELGLSDARWHTSEKNKGVDHDWVDRLDPDRDIVIVITDFISHALSIPIKTKCQKKRITRLDGRPTKKGILDALERHFDGRD